MGSYRGQKWAAAASCPCWPGPLHPCLHHSRDMFVSITTKAWYKTTLHVARAEEEGEHTAGSGFSSCRAPLHTMRCAGKERRRCACNRHREEGVATKHTLVEPSGAAKRRQKVWVSTWSGQSARQAQASAIKAPSRPRACMRGVENGASWPAAAGRVNAHLGRVGRGMMEGVLTGGRQGVALQRSARA